jgi:phage regulator Rha-like protein
MDLIKQEIENQIYYIRERQVMLDIDLSVLYGVEARTMNQAIKRNIERFPESFRFQLTAHEWDLLNTQTKITRAKGGRRYMPYAFTEQGISMLSAVLRSPTAIQVSISIINAFVEMRKLLSSNATIYKRLENIELKQQLHDINFNKLFKALDENQLIPNHGIFFDGEVFDAHTLVSDIIRSAKKKIILIDNYIDDTVFKLLIKRSDKVKAIIFTNKITKTLEADIDKHNKQYPTIELKKLKTSHDRFMIIDDKIIYHIGASLKDLGKKWFAFSKLEIDINDILTKLK